MAITHSSEAEAGKADRVSPGVPANMIANSHCTSSYVRGNVLGHSYRLALISYGVIYLETSSLE